MSNVRIKLNSGNIRAFLKSSEMQSMLESRAAGLGRAEGKELEVVVKGSRAIAKPKNSKKPSKKRSKKRGGSK